MKVLSFLFVNELSSVCLAHLTQQHRKADCRTRQRFPARGAQGDPFLSEPHSPTGTAQGCLAVVVQHFHSQAPLAGRAQEKGRQFISLNWHPALLAQKGHLSGVKIPFYSLRCCRWHRVPSSQPRGWSSRLHWHWLPWTGLSFPT